MAVEVDGDVLEGFEGADDAFDADPGGVLEVAGYSQRGYDHGQVSLDLDCWRFSDSACFVLQAAFFRSRNSLSTSSGVRYPRAERRRIRFVSKLDPRGNIVHRFVLRWVYHPVHSFILERSVERFRPSVVPAHSRAPH